jgi:hypothetical protein
MAFNQSETKEIEKIAREEVRKFMSSNTVKQFEDKLLDMVAKEIKNGKMEKDVKEIVTKVFSEFYKFMWQQRNYWEPRLKNA